MQYKIVECGTADELEKKVEMLMEDGWKPQGGVSVSVMGALSEDTFYQAMTHD